MIRGKTLRRAVATLTAVLMLSIAVPASADSLILPILLPGLGQAQNGHYGKASVLGTAAFVSWIGLFATQINYSRTVERYESEKRNYLAYQDQLDSGEPVYIGDINETYTNMSDAYEQAEDDEKWRNVFIGALVVTYGINLIDLLMADEDTGEVERAPETSLEWRGDGLRLVRTIRF